MYNTVFYTGSSSTCDGSCAWSSRQTPRPAGILCHTLPTNGGEDLHPREAQGDGDDHHGEVPGECAQSVCSRHIPSWRIGGLQSGWHQAGRGAFLKSVKLCPQILYTRWRKLSSLDVLCPHTICIF